MDQIITGALKFMQDDFKKYKKLFENLASSQKPHTLFICCSDSRVVPNLITHTEPGEIFVLRNIANIVPTYEQSDKFLDIASDIEFAVLSLKVKNIIICGHDNCGGCAAVYKKKETLKNMPNLLHWLDPIFSIKEKVLYESNTDISERALLTERLNVVNSVENLLTFPFIKEKFNAGEIKIYGWHYMIKTGEIFNYSFDDKKFHLIKKEAE